jgi:transposase
MNSELTDAQWARIQPHLPPPKKGGRPRAQDRRTINGTLYVLRTGSRWQDLPPEYGSPVTWGAGWTNGWHLGEDLMSQASWTGAGLFWRAALYLLKSNCFKMIKSLRIQAVRATFPQRWW